MDLRLPFSSERSLASRLSGYERRPEFLFKDDGVSLIVVLWVLTFLMFIVVEFTYSMRVEASAVTNYKDETEARFIAYGGINLALAELGGKYDIVFVDDGGRLVLGSKGVGGVKSLEVERDFVLGNGTVSYRIEDERGKLNINTLDRDGIKNLLRITGVPVTERGVIADSIIDWRDANHEFHMNGAEDDYYASLDEPYGAKDGPFDTIEELLLVRGMTPEIFYGDGNIPPEIAIKGLSSQAGSGYEGIYPYITVSGDGKVNINSADKVVLDTVFGEGRSIEIKLHRETVKHYLQPAYGGVINSRYFTVYSVGEVRGIAVGVKAHVEATADNKGVRVSYWNEEAVGIN